MGFEIQFECVDCLETTPAFKMWMNKAPDNLGQWLYEHGHCANQWLDEDSLFRRHNEHNLLNDGMQDWHFPMSRRSCKWDETLESNPDET